MPEERSLYLASQSQRRRDLLRQFSIPFSVIPNTLTDETLDPKLPLRAALRQLAYQKAQASRANYNGLILGVDTIVTFRGKVYGKPGSLSEAAQFLHELSGNTHQVITAYCLLDTICRTRCTRSEVTQVTFQTLTPAVIDHYLTHFEVLDKAGAYAIQEYGDTLITAISGSYSNVVGLPVESLKRMLRKYSLIPTGETA